MTSSTDSSELLELLHRCEQDAAPPADLAALEVLLQEQEQGQAWGSIRAGLQRGLQVEGDLVDVAPTVLRQVDLAQAGASQAMDALRGGLAVEAEQADLTDAVMHFVAPAPRVELERHIDALAAGLRREARLHLPADLAGAVLDQLQPERDRTLEHALQLMAQELVAQAAEVSLAEPVMQAVSQVAAEQLELCAMVDGELSAEQRRAVGARLGADLAGRAAITGMAELGRQLRQALAHEVAGHDLGPIWPAVQAQLGMQDQASWAQAMAAGIQDEAGSIDIADLVMDSIVPAAALPAATEDVPEVTAAPEPELAPEPRARPAAVPWFRRLPLVSFAVSAVALLFVLNSMNPKGVGPSVEPAPSPETALAIFQISDVNTIEIQQLEVAENAMVQVFQLEEGAPMVILIDEGLEPDTVEGVTL